MNDERWSEVKAILAEVLESSAAERLSVLNRLCGSDAELRNAVESLLEVETRANELMDSAVAPGAALQRENMRPQPAHPPPWWQLKGPAREAFLEQACSNPEIRKQVQALLNRSPDATPDLNPTESLNPTGTTGMVVGRYHLLQKIGEGGMGEVWLAGQKEPVRRHVALKLVKAGMNTRQVIARFESERQALALMDHPAIAKVLDAGSTPQGAPYFVMEYVAGVPITTYCDRRRLNTRGRLELFMHVCEGVQHAHQKAIIRRDLKPSNILVTEVDGRAAPKIIDFGVAKALAQKLSADTIYTGVGAMIGTPQYMSPEQALSAGEDIDTRTDVYSLGIIFYELLAGTPPIELQKIVFEEFLRRLREEEPAKPSTKIRTQDTATSTEIARNRQTESQALARLMRGDLDSIALKALEKERARRYGSPAEFAADVGSYLRNEAVLAVPPSLGYRARKFARRYRTALAIVSVFILVLIIAGTVAIRQGIRANREAAVAEAVNHFLQSDLLAQASSDNQSSPSTKPDPHLEVRTTLDRAAARIAGKFLTQPEVEAAIRDTIGQTYSDLGLYPEAREQLERALELQRRVLGPRNPTTLRTMSLIGSAAVLQGKYPEADALLSQALEIQRRVLGGDHPGTLASLNELATSYTDEGKYPQAGEIYKQVLEIRRRLSGPEHPDTLKTMHDLAAIYNDEGKYADAGELVSQTLEIRRRVLGPEHPSTLATMGNLARNYYDQRKYAQAEDLFRQTVEIRRRVSGPDHPATLVDMQNLAVIYATQGKCAQAEALSIQILETRRRVLGPEHSSTLNSAGNLAACYSCEAKWAQAAELFASTLEIKRRVLGAEHPSTLATLADFAFMYQRQSNYALAVTYDQQVLAGRRHKLGPEHPDTMASASDLALAYVSERKFAEAEALAREALDFNQKKQLDDWQRFRAESLLGASLAGQKKFAEAEPLLLEGYQGMLARKDRIAVPDWYHLDRAHESLVQFYQDWGKPDQAAGWSKR